MYKHIFNSIKQPLHLAICQKMTATKTIITNFFKKFILEKQTQQNQTKYIQTHNKLNKLNSFPTIE